MNNMFGMSNKNTAIFYAAFAVLFAFFCISNLMQGDYIWAAIDALFVVWDVSLAKDAYKEWQDEY